jgi:hypothetical protein
LVALGGGGQVQLIGGFEIVQNPAPRSFGIGPAPVAFVDDNEIEEIGRVGLRARMVVSFNGMWGHRVFGACTMPPDAPPNRGHFLG